MRSRGYWLLSFLQEHQHLEHGPRPVQLATHQHDQNSHILQKTQDHRLLHHQKTRQSATLTFHPRQDSHDYPTMPTRLSENIHKP